MSKNDVLTSIRTRNPQTPQTERANERQVQNAAGGYVYGVGDWAQVGRFIVMGSEGSYYTSARAMTLDNAHALMRAIDIDPVRVVDMIVEISTQGRAAKQQPGLLALAAVSGLANDEGRRAAVDAFSKVARTSSTFFTLMKYVQQFRSWSGRAAKTAGRAWYTERTPEKLAYQMIKYRQRDGFTQTDAIRILHPVPPTPAHDALFKWALTGEVGEHLPHQVKGFIALQGAVTAEEAAGIITLFDLPWEAVPDRFMNERVVWEALLDANIGMTALIRALPRLTNLGLVGKGKGTRVSQVVEQLTDTEALRRARIHPMNALVALKTYAGGHSLEPRSSTRWTPERKIIDALDEAFYATFKVAEPTGKRILLAVDCSGSMTGGISGMPLTANEAAGAMALSVAKVEKDYDVVGFTSGSSRYSYGRDFENGLTELTISPRQRLDDAMRTLQLSNFGATDCALPFTWALEKSAYYDAVVVLTDAETWAGPIHVDQALRNYRAKINPNARLICAAFTATSYSIADPKDMLSLDIAGLDSAVPSLIQNFIRGEF